MADIEALAGGDMAGLSRCLSMALISSLLLLPQPVFANAASPVPDEETVAIVKLPRGVKFIGFPECCPGKPCTTLSEDEICMAELYDGKAKIVRRFSGPGFGKGTILRFTAHAARTRGPLYFLVWVRPFEDGQTKGVFARWHDRPEADGAFCTPVDWVNEWSDGPVRQLLLKQPQRTISDGDSRYLAHCVSGKSN